MGCHQSRPLKSNSVTPESSAIPDQQILFKFDILLQLLNKNAQKTPYGLYVNSLTHPYSPASNVSRYSSINNLLPY